MQGFINILDVRLSHNALQVYNYFTHFTPLLINFPMYAEIEENNNFIGAPWKQKKQRWNWIIIVKNKIERNVI